jgi:serine/threonine-protein kinase
VPRVGNTVGGKFVLQDMIGEGAMGSVWKAVHTTLGRPFAVKFLKSAGSGAKVLEERFLREAKMLASVQHRFVVSVVDFGLTDEDTPYMVMEYLQGVALADRLAQAPALTARELLRLVAEALVGLEAVHQAGIIHRDLKPDNIMLVSEAGGIIPKLVDFGISRPEILSADLAATPKLTAPGMTMGTPCYMSPEQVRLGRKVDRRTDIYSMGVILYESLAGKVPYDGEEQREIFKLIDAAEAPPLIRLRPEVGALLSGLVERTMAKNPAARFASAGELAATVLSVAKHIPESLLCPCPGHMPSESSASSAPHILPEEAEISSEVLVLPTNERTRVVRLRGSRRRLVVGVVASFVVVGVGALLLVRGLTSTKAPTLTQNAPAVQVPAPSPVAPIVAPAAPVIPAAPAPRASETAAAPVPEIRPSEPTKPRPARPRPPKNSDKKPGVPGTPEAFTDPGF